MAQRISTLEDAARRASGIDSRYFNLHRVPKYNGRQFTYEHARLMRQEFPEVSKEEHEKKAKKFAEEREYYAGKHGRLRRKYVKQHGFDSLNWYANGVSPKFTDAENNRLRKLARLASDCHRISEAHWKAAGRRKDNPFLVRRVYVYTK